ncbi:TIGR02300 family protein [Candidatus Pelagibacter sp. HIMB1517]|uniref:TIGR02300 family protein n=1 Tax=Candidatus Pelagibacter sp. HIMB1517 TaxID=3413341 RepID=UPI003F83DE6B
MADKKFGQKRVCTNCEVKFYDLNKKSPLSCPHCNSEIVIEDELSFVQSPQVNQQQNKSNVKDEFADIDNADSDSEDQDEEVISLDDAAIEEGSKN